MCRSFSELFAAFPNDTFIETGTYFGHGVDSALTANCFRRIFSIELSQQLAAAARKRFEHIRCVSIMQGNSYDVLPHIFEVVDCPATFFLDAHYSQGDTAGSFSDPVLYKELDVLKDFRHMPSSVVIIDDAGIFGSPNGLPSITLDRVVEKLTSIWGNPSIQQFKISDAHEIIICKQRGD